MSQQWGYESGVIEVKLLKVILKSWGQIPIASVYNPRK